LTLYKTLNIEKEFLKIGVEIEKGSKYLMEKRKMNIRGVDQLQLLGSRDEYLNLILQAFPVTIVVRGDTILISGDPAEVALVEKVFMELIFLVNRNGQLNHLDVQTVIDMIRQGGGEITSKVERDSQVICYVKKGVIQPKTQGQEQYYRSVVQNDIVFVIGPAGTGKTYLAVAMALAQLKEREVSRIILTRPAREAGESLGFLPGDLMEKVDPYLRPLTDALFEMLPADQLQKYVERKVIEIVPLAYMRGRTLNDAFVILDEAQNTSPMQMKMFLTRLGIHSKAIITGDVTQIDLPDTMISGLVQIQDILKGIDGIGFVTLGKGDVVRHRLVKDIIQAYETFKDNSKEEGLRE
jgi:phosphate starvation-inducible PhoH-like protein